MAQLAALATLVHEACPMVAFLPSALIRGSFDWKIGQVPDTHFKWESGTCPYFPAFTVSARAFMLCDRICSYDCTILFKDD